MTMHVMSLSTLVDCLCPMILSCIDLRPWHVKLEYITTSLMILFLMDAGLFLFENGLICLLLAQWLMLSLGDSTPFDSSDRSFKGGA
jgi:hypothetical protein